jgi:hypothetical protein
MPVGGKLVLKGGYKVTSGGVRKKRTTVKQRHGDDVEHGGDEKLDAVQPDGSAAHKVKAYEEEFNLEMEKAKRGKAKATPWGSGFTRPPDVLHGYSEKVTGKTAEERLDIRAGMGYE